MADDKLDLPGDYDPDAEAEDVTGRAPRGRGQLVRGLRRLKRINGMRADLDEKRKALLAELVPMIDRPVRMLDPDTGKPIHAVGIQRTVLSVKVDDLRQALYDHFYEDGVVEGMLTAHNAAELIQQYKDEVADKVTIIINDVLKPPEVDTKDDGLFVQAVQNNVIPQEVAAKVVKEKKVAAYISFPAPQKGTDKSA